MVLYTLFRFRFGIHSWYCNNGEACVKVLSQYQNYSTNTLYLIRESIYESLMVLFLGVILNYKLTNLYLFFSIGVMLHIIAEQLWIHKNLL